MLYMLYFAFILFLFIVLLIMKDRIMDYLTSAKPL